MALWFVNEILKEKNIQLLLIVEYKSKRKHILSAKCKRHFTCGSTWDFIGLIWILFGSHSSTKYISILNYEFLKGIFFFINFALFGNWVYMNNSSNTLLHHHQIFILYSTLLSMKVYFAATR